jgi:hypothetical protein
MTRGGVLAVFLILALILCHGVYGAGHQLAPAYEAHGGHSAHEHGGEGTHPAGHLSGMVYAAVLLVFFIAAASMKFVRAELGILNTQSSMRVSPPDILQLPRGPTLGFLQVFRL